MNEHITKEKFDELEKISKPVQDFMLANFDMMCKVEIDTDGVRILRSEMFAPLPAEL
jgi:hypothetical protein